MNNSGKSFLTIFLFVIAILLVSLTAIAVFFFLKEVDLRKAAEYNLEQVQIVEAKAQNELKDLKQQLFLMEGKSKEAEGKIENLLEEVDLEQGLREEIKKENQDLQTALEKANSEKQTLQSRLDDELVVAEEKILSLQEELSAAIKEKEGINARRQELEQECQVLKKKLGIEDTSAVETEPNTAAVDPGKVELDTIVITPSGEGAGTVISVDRETDFVIVSLGEKDGVKKNDILSISRDGKYLGDIQVTRVLPEMSAADFISPLTSQMVDKEDQVFIKE